MSWMKNKFSPDEDDQLVEGSSSMHNRINSRVGRHETQQLLTRLPWLQLALQLRACERRCLSRLGEVYSATWLP